MSDHLLRLSEQYPVVTVTGPRQSAKTTLCRSLFKDKTYVNLESLAERNFAQADPRGFIARFQEGAVLEFGALASLKSITLNDRNWRSTVAELLPFTAALLRNLANSIILPTWISSGRLT